MEPSKKRPYSGYARYSTMAFQMIATIGLGVWGGIKLDEHFHTSPVLTLILSLLGVGGAMYWATKDLLKKDKE